jgi:hypothetical protein
MLVIIETTGIVTKGLKKKLETIPGKYSISSLLEIAMLETSCIIQKVMVSET